MLTFLFSFCFITYVSSLDLSKSYVVCNVQSSYPTIAEVINSLLPLKTVQNNFKSIPNFNLNGTSHIGGFLNTRIPLISFVSHGEYEVSYERPMKSFSFSDIYILEENYVTLNVICNTFGGFLGPFNSICSCWRGEPYSGKVESNHHSAQWCVAKPLCSDKSIDVGHCSIPVDAMRNTCVLVTVNSDDFEESSLEHLVRYKRKVPTLANVWNTLLSATQQGRQLLSEPDSASPILVGVQHVVKTILSYLPLHLVLLALGAYVVMNARELAEQEPFQLFMIGLYGLLLAFIFLLYGLYRMSDQLLKRYGGPLLPFVQIPVLLSMGSFLFTNPYLPSVIFSSLVAFWESGAPFGVWWLGKAYFLLSVLASYYLSHLFKLFQADSRSWQLMHHSVRLIGLLLLSQSTSSTELSAVLVLLGMFPDNVSHLGWTLYLLLATCRQTPSYKYIGTGQKLSSDKLEALSRRHTQRHLEKLKLHLQSNPDVLDNVADRLREGGKTEEMRLISRFAEGTYPGVPYTTPTEVDSTSLNKGSILLYLFMVLLFVVLATVFYDKGRNGDL